MAASLYPQLFTPGQIGTLRVKNRVVMSPMATQFSNRDGSPTERVLAHYRERARGGVGLIICEYAYVDQKASKANLCQLGAYDDECIPGLARLAETIRFAGARAGAQISHCGRQKFHGEPVVAPSRIPWERFSGPPSSVPKELTVEEIREIVAAYGQAARRVKQAGFDLVEVHGGHGYLITEFLSPYTNRRNDLYGGSLRGRMRFLLEIVDRIRSNVGPSYPFSVRLSRSDLVEGGFGLDETIEVAKALEQAGVDAIHVSAATHETTEWQIAPMYLDHGLNVEAAAAVKAAVKIPVLVVGSISSPAHANTILAEGKADFITFGRALLADPHLARKAREGRPEDIRPCIRCNEGCLDRRRRNLQGINCTVNFTVGRQDEFGEEIEPARTARRVVVVGAGPGGLEAARVAARRGHRVTLFERRSRLGGWLVETSVPAFKADLRPYLAYLTHEVARLGVEVRHEEATAEAVEAIQPDAVILATGSIPARPRIVGADGPNVVLATEVLGGRAVGERVVVVGADIKATETALYLGQQGKRVDLVHTTPELAIGTGLGSRRVLAGLLKTAGVGVHLGMRLEEVFDGGAVAIDAKGRPQKLMAETVVLAGSFVPAAGLLGPLEAAGLDVYPVGDCVRPRGLYDAIHEGHAAARRL